MTTLLPRIVRGELFRVQTHSPADLVGFAETGKASYYAMRYQFQHTARGERFNQLASTVAHKQLNNSLLEIHFQLTHPFNYFFNVYSRIREPNVMLFLTAHYPSKMISCTERNIGLAQSLIH